MVYLKKYIKFFQLAVCLIGLQLNSLIGCRQILCCMCYSKWRCSIAISVSELYIKARSKFQDQCLFVFLYFKHEPLNTWWGEIFKQHTLETLRFLMHAPLNSPDGWSTYPQAFKLCDSFSRIKGTLCPQNKWWLHPVTPMKDGSSRGIFLPGRTWRMMNVRQRRLLSTFFLPDRGDFQPILISARGRLWPSTQDEDSHPHATFLCHLRAQGNPKTITLRLGSANKAGYENNASIFFQCIADDLSWFCD